MVKPEYFVTGFERFSKQCDAVHFVFLFFIPEDLEQLLYQHMLVLHSVRNSTSVLKQLKCRLRNVCCLIKDLCVQYVVPKYVLDICCFQNTYLIPLVQYFTIFYKFLAST